VSVFGNYKKLPLNEINLNENLLISIYAFRSDTFTANINGKNYTASDESRLLTEVKITMRNTGDKECELTDLNTLEMVYIKNSGEFKFTPQAIRLEQIDKKSPGKIPIKRVFYETICFTHEKGDIPVALTANRTNHILLIDNSNSKYNEIVSFLNSQSKIPEMMTLAQTDSFETVNNFRIENNIDINAAGRNGLNLLYIGILFKNDSVVTGAISNGIDLHKKTRYSIYGEIEPIHVALMTHNRYAIEALLKAGVDIKNFNSTIGNDSPAGLAIRSNNLEAVKLLTEYGVDLKSLTIPMRRGFGTIFITALEFARNRNMTEMVQYLESLKTR
jgi:hypothetical protein